MKQLEMLFSVLGAFFKSNPAVEEAELILPAVVQAIQNAKTGAPWSVGIPVPELKGTITVGFQPSA